MRNQTTKLRKMMWKMGMFCCFFAFFFLLSGCKKEATSDTTSDSTSASSQEVSEQETGIRVNPQGPWHIGVAQLAQHPSLDLATQGFVDTLRDKLGDQVEIDVQNASGETATVSTIVNNFVSQKVDLILANATAPLQLAAAATESIPILGTSVTDYASALELTDYDGVVGTNVSGTSDLSPFEEQVEIFEDLFPAPKTVGILYSSSEANSVFQVEEMKERLTSKGYEVKEFSFTDSNDIAPVTTQATSEVDVLYIPTDNLAASNAEGIANVVLPAKIPVITADSATGSVLGVASLSVDYYELGKMTGEMAIRVLKGEEDIREMKVESATGVHKMVNAKIAKEFGITVPDDYQVIEGTEAE